MLTRGLSLPNIIDESIYEDESKTSFINSNGNESVSSMEQLLDNGIASTPEENYVSRSIWTECDKTDYVEKQSVAVQVSADFTLLNKEIAEQSTSCQTDNDELNYCVHKAVNTAENITSTSTFKRERKTEATETNAAGDQIDGVGAQVVARLQDLSSCDRAEKKRELKLEIAKQETAAETWMSANVLPEVHKVPVRETNVCNGFDKPASYGDFRVNVEILQHEFGPLPPSPVEEVDDEYADVLHSVPTNRKSDSLSNDSAYRRNSRISASGSIRSSRVPDVPPHRDQSSSLKTRSVDAGFTRNHRTQFLGSRKDVIVLHFLRLDRLMNVTINMDVHGQCRTD